MQSAGNSALLLILNYVGWLMMMVMAISLILLAAVNVLCGFKVNYQVSGGRLFYESMSISVHNKLGLERGKK